MMRDENIRVRTHARYARLYNDLTKFVVGYSHELFYVCACLGYQERRRQPLGRNAEERFWSGTIASMEWVTYYAILLRESGMDFSAVQEDKNVIACIEEYANAGMEILLDELLCDYLIGDQREPRLDRSVSKELPKAFLSFIYERLNLEGQEVA